MNWAAWTLLILFTANMFIVPFLFGKSKSTRWGAGDVIASIVVFILALFAFEII